MSDEVLEGLSEKEIKDSELEAGKDVVASLFRQCLSIPIEVPNAKTRAAIKEAEQGSLPSFDTVSELMADLKKD